MFCTNCGRLIPDNPGDVSCIACGYDPADLDQVAARDEAADHRRRDALIDRLMQTP